MRRLRARLDVELVDEHPVRIRWAGRTYRVERLIDCWVVEGRWWAREERRLYFRLWTDRGTLEIYRSGAHWMLSRILD